MLLCKKMKLILDMEFSESKKACNRARLMFFIVLVSD